MIRTFFNRPLTKIEKIQKLSQATEVKALAIQIVALAERDNSLPGHKFNAIG